MRMEELKEMLYGMEGCVSLLKGLNMELKAYESKKTIPDYVKSILYSLPETIVSESTDALNNLLKYKGKGENNIITEIFNNLDTILHEMDALISGLRRKGLPVGKLNDLKILLKEALVYAKEEFYKNNKK